MGHVYSGYRRTDVTLRRATRAGIGRSRYISTAGLRRRTVCAGADGLSQPLQNLLSDLPGGVSSLSFWHVLHVKHIGILLVNREGIDVRDLLLIHQVIENPAEAQQESTVNHDDVISFLDPACHS